MPADFRFTVKAPNSLTLTHFYRKARHGPLAANPWFLSPDLFQRFLDLLEPLHDLLGPLIFQFEYLVRGCRLGPRPDLLLSGAALRHSWPRVGHH